jgi:BirA family biotin operon repressor/biotin-[acetyl-CoA-carboxylase] ligase
MAFAQLDSKRDLIIRLADGRYHSGEELGRELGISRAAVWKQLQKLSEWGVEFESCKRRGYRIPGGLSLLDSDTITGNLEPAIQSLITLQVLQRVDSTNEIAMRLARDSGASGSLVLAEMQTEGKGRRGRAWVSPYGRNIYLSAIHHYSGGVAVTQGLSLAVGVVVVQLLQDMDIHDLQLKWPNDILWQGKKLGGILLEISGDPAGSFDVIVGLGINVNMSPREGSEIDQRWTTLADIAGAVVDRNILSAKLANSLLPMLIEYEKHGFSHYRSTWQQLDSCLDQLVVLTAGDREISGIAKGVTESGALCIETPHGRHEFSGGEVSLRSHP